MWRSLVSRMVRVHEAAGSNPATPTIYKPSTFVQSRRFFICLFHITSSKSYDSPLSPHLAELVFYPKILTFSHFSKENCNENRNKNYPSQFPRAGSSYHSLSFFIFHIRFILFPKRYFCFVRHFFEPRCNLIPHTGRDGQTA